MGEASLIPPKVDSDLDGWHERLLRSLRECGVQPAPGHIVLRYLAAGGACLLFAVVMNGVYLLGSLAERNGVAPLAIFLCQAPCWLFGVLVLLRIKNFLVRNARRASARSAEKELSASNSRRPIFYLRSFAMDHVYERPTWLDRLLGDAPIATMEQRITSKLRKKGPVIAIGRPAEKLPPLGAARFYVPDALWQQKVDEVARESQLVVWMSGHTTGLGWELEHLTSNIKPERFVLWAHPHVIRLGEQQREEEWRAFLAKFGKHFPKPLPSRLGDARFIAFIADWTPIPIPPRISAVFAKPDASALDRLLLVREAKCDEPAIQSLIELSQTRNCRYFGDVIGARKVERDWPRLLAFALSLGLANYLMMRLALRWPNGAPRPTFTILGFAYGQFATLLQVALLAAAYRFFRPSVVAIPLGAAAATIGQWLRGGGFYLSSIPSKVAMLGPLAFTVKYSSRLWIGLLLGGWIGVFLGVSISTLIAGLQLDDPHAVSLSWGESWSFTIGNYFRGLGTGIVGATANAVLLTFFFCTCLKLLPLAFKKLD